MGFVLLGQRTNRLEWVSPVGGQIKDSGILSIHVYLLFIASFLFSLMHIQYIMNI